MLPPEEGPTRRSSTTQADPTTRAGIAHRFGVTEADLEAAKKRLQRRIKNNGQDQRTIGNEFEQNLVREYAANMANQSHAPTKAELTVVLVEILGQRAAKARAGNGLQLTEKEKAFLAKPPAERRLHKAFWYRFLHRNGLVTGAIKVRDQQRAAWYTTATASKHFSTLNDVLKSLGFLVEIGRYQGEIKESCLGRILNADETTALTAPAFQAAGVYDPVTAAAAVRVGAEHHGSVTAFLTINARGQFFMPFVIFAKSILTNDYLNKEYDFIISTATENGYIDTEALKAYARFIRMQLGHDETVLLIMDGHRTRLASGVITYFASLAIYIYIIPPHTSHALAPLDQYNQELHRFYCLCLHELYMQGGFLSETMRLEAFYKALKIIASNPDEVIAAWKHAGITKKKRDMQLLKVSPRRLQLTTPSASPSTSSTLALLDSPHSGKTVTLSLDHVRRLRIALRDARNEKSTKVAEVRAVQEVLIEKKQERVAKILNDRLSRRNRVTKGKWGASTSEEIKQYLAEQMVKEQQAKERQQRLKDKQAREKPLLDQLEARGFARGGKTITKDMLAEALKAEGQKSSGSREQLIERLSRVWELEEGDDAAAAAGAAASAAGGNDSETTSSDEDDDGELEAADPDPEPGAIVAEEVDAHQQRVNEARIVLQAQSQPNAELIAELLSARTPAMQKWWQEQEALVANLENKWF